MYRRLIFTSPLSSCAVSASELLNTSTPGVMYWEGLYCGILTFEPLGDVTLSVTSVCSPISISIESIFDSTKTWADAHNVHVMNDIMQIICFIKSYSVKGTTNARLPANIISYDCRVCLLVPHGK